MRAYVGEGEDERMKEKAAVTRKHIYRIFV